MNHDEILRYCLSKPGAFLDYPFGPNTVSLDGTVPDGDIIRMIDHAFQTAVSRMPGYARRELREKAHEA